MSHRGRIVAGLVAVALVVGAAGLGLWLLRSDSGRDPGRQDTADPGYRADELDCLDGIYANTDFALDGDDGGSFVVCHYDKLPVDPSSATSHELASSRELSAAESRAVRGAIAAAPRGEPPFTGCDAANDGPGEFFLLRTPEQVAYWVYNASCGDNGVLAMSADGELVHRHVTARLLEALGSAYEPLGPS